MIFILGHFKAAYSLHGVLFGLCEIECGVLHGRSFVDGWYINTEG